MTNIVAIASDHAGVELKEHLVDILRNIGFVALDLGTNTKDSVDYPDYANSLAASIKSGHAKQGILICGSGIGISIAANRHPHIRAALCFNEEMAKLARQHNDANVLVLGARFIEKDNAANIVKTFFTTSFEGGRHALRVEKLNKSE